MGVTSMRKEDNIRILGLKVINNNGNIIFSDNTTALIKRESQEMGNSTQVFCFKRGLFFANGDALVAGGLRDESAMASGRTARDNSVIGRKERKSSSGTDGGIVGMRTEANDFFAGNEVRIFDDSESFIELRLFRYFLSY